MPVRRARLSHAHRQRSELTAQLVGVLSVLDLHRRRASRVVKRDDVLSERQGGGRVVMLLEAVQKSAVRPVGERIFAARCRIPGVEIGVGQAKTSRTE